SSSPTHYAPRSDENKRRTRAYTTAHCGCRATFTAAAREVDGDGARGLQRLQEGHERVAIGLRHGAEILLRRFGLTAVPQDRLGEAARAPVVQEELVIVDRGQKAEAPQRRRAPLRARRQIVG